MPKGLDRAYSATAEQGHRPSMQCVPALVQHAGITTTAAQRQRQSMHRDYKQLRLCVATANQHHRQSICIATARAADHARIQRSNGRDNKCVALATRWREHASSADYALQRQINGSEIACIATARARNTMHRYGGATAATSMHRYDKSSVDYASLRGRNGRDRGHAPRRREQGRLCIDQRRHRAFTATARAA